MQRTWLLFTTVAAGSIVSGASGITIQVPINIDTIQGAIDRASNGDVVLVWPGVYQEHIDFDGKQIVVCSAEGAAATVIDGSFGPGPVVRFASSESEHAVLDRFTIRGGQNDGDGGGMYIGDSRPTIRHCIFENNTAARGAGLYMIDAEPDLVGCTFIENIAEESGGAMYLDGSAPSISSSHFVQNRAVAVASQSAGGGAIFAADSSPLIQSCTFESNFCFLDGAALRSVDRSFLVILDSSFTSNFAEMSGGAIASSGDSDLYVEASEFEHNVAGRFGGAISSESDSDVELIAAIFSRNQAGFEGGAARITDASSLIAFTTFSDNATDGNGGALALEGAQHEVLRSAFLGNEAELNGGGVMILDAIVSISRSPFILNLAGESGGGVYALSSTLAIDASELAENDAYLIGGGAVAAVRSTMTLTKATVRDNGSDGLPRGGGLYIDRSDLHATGSSFMGNLAATAGGAVYGSHGTTRFVRCAFTDNQAAGTGGAISNDTATLVTSCLFSENVVGASGGAIAGPVEATNCTFANNSGSAGGGAVSADAAAAVVIANSILRGDAPIGAAGALVTYSNVQGGWPGEGNVDVDPMFVDPSQDDYSLSADSMVIDAGDTFALHTDASLDLDGAPRIVDDTGRADSGHGCPTVDMGAFERQVSACDGDFDRNGQVNFDDLIELLARWVPAPPPCLTGASDWQNLSMLAESGEVRAELNVTPWPLGATLNGFVGMSYGEGVGAEEFAIVVRFNANGFIDAGNVGTYESEALVRYQPGASYHLRIDVSVAAGTYSVFVTTPEGNEVRVARSYGFQVSQTSVLAIDNWGVYAEVGMLDACEFEVTATTTNCPLVSNDAQVGFQNLTSLLGNWGPCP